MLELVRVPQVAQRGSRAEGIILDNPSSPAEVDMVNNLLHVDGRGCSANNDVRRLGIGKRLPGDDYGSRSNSRAAPTAFAGGQWQGHSHGPRSE